LFFDGRILLRGGRGVKNGRVGAIPWAACAVILFMLTSVTRREWAVAGAVIAVAALLFLATRGRRARAAA